MKLSLVALKDRATDNFGKIITVRTTGEAVRSLSDEVRNNESAISKHPEDYDLYLVGYFNEDTGQIHAPEEGPSVIVRAQDLTK